MATLNIVKYGDPLLRKHSRPVDAITPRILQLLDDMTETMRMANGCGLAAVQIGVLRRVVVIEVEDGTSGGGRRVPLHSRALRRYGKTEDGDRPRDRQRGEKL